ncbi:MAG TPA: hypothetical protein P5279_17480 [Anaerohalosphaeraceae bacterium]|jgi:hypothetical protein|nr:hypothetical protein [Anaerohalosphaeraceae bacterium]HRT52285.1 hypothetical protein [Anaerohalosphaeraceae bacterium]HRT88394.1 hypothetical protein [Anaerohalosphaeraceae bacterium]
MAKQNQTTTRPSAAPGPNRGQSAQSADNTAEVVEFCRKLNVTAELVGRWIWVSFPEAPDEATRKALKEYGFRWSARRGKWAHNCGVPTKSAHQSDPWAKYGSKIVHQAKAAV